MANFKLDYTGQKVNELLGKAAKSINSSDIAGLASENYVDNAIDNLDIPIVDSVLDLESTNAIANKSVATALYPIEKYNVPMIDGQYGGKIWSSSTSGITTTLNSVCYGKETYVAVGDGGTILTSPDGVIWTPQISGVTIILRDIAYGNNQFVVVGDSGIILTSLDGITWKKQTSGITTIIYSICYDNGLYVAVGDGGKIITSPDGVTWTSQTSGVAVSLRGICYGNGLYVAVGKSSQIITSPNGLTWTIQASNTGYYASKIDFSDIVYGNGLYVAVGSGYYSLNKGIICTSYDGITWEMNVIGCYLYGICYGGKQFVYVGKYGYVNNYGNSADYIRVLISKNGVDIETPSINVTGILRGACYGNDLYIAVGDSGKIITSDATFNANGLSLPIPLTEYETNKIVNIKAPMTLTNTQLNINSLGAKTINGTIEQDKNYELVYNGSSWDINTNGNVTKEYVDNAIQTAIEELLKEIKQ